ncbi:LOW QUALITY PROTEIN: uncharacterized protein LOC134209345 [Armigeres subalbatus]|uniref:LOW QUALITY PROTEIN: uncharacterized protein LOC134209345 n=1 Tax=Armigeres subalbatus TaxID=124917 RepID=UPI002ED02EEE
MATTANSRPSEPNGGTLGPRKTLIIMVTVVGCIAILWPKVFYPMMVGPTQTKPIIKDHRGSGCCDVVLDQEETFANVSINVPNQQNLFRKRIIGPAVEDHSIRQERPPHLRPETIHPAMRERGRAIPAGSVHSERPQSPPRIVEGRPGPIPGMRPPMGAGSHQSTKSANSMGFIMPLYTIGIVSFFIYTILKLIFKKTPATPYPEIKPDTTFRNEVFTAPDQPYIKRPDSGTTKLGQPIANGENGAPVSVGPVSNGSASASFNHSVQAEISVDYQQLVTKPESPPATTDSRNAAEEPVTEHTGPVEQGNDEASSVTEATNDKEQVQPEYDPAIEKLVDGIVVQKVVQLNEEASTSENIERVASEVVEEVLQEAESEINEAAEAAAVKLVEKVVEQAEATVLATEIPEVLETHEEESTSPNATYIYQRRPIYNVSLLFADDVVQAILETDQKATDVATELVQETIVDSKPSETIPIEQTALVADATNIVTEAETALEAIVNAETVKDTIKGVTFDDEVIVVDAPIAAEVETITDTLVDAEEATIKALAEAIDQEAEDIGAVAEGLVNEVLDEIQEIVNEKEVLEPTQAPSYDSATQALVSSSDNEAVVESEPKYSEEKTNESSDSFENETSFTVEVDAEEAVIKAEAISQQAEEAEVVATAEELVNEVLDQAQEIAKEKGALEHVEAASHDPAMQKQVDDALIDGFAYDADDKNFRKSLEQSSVEEVVESISIKEVNSELNSAPSQQTIISENDVVQPAGIC